MITKFLNDQNPEIRKTLEGPIQKHAKSLGRSLSESECFLYASGFMDGRMFELNIKEKELNEKIVNCESETEDLTT